LCRYSQRILEFSGILSAEMDEDAREAAAEDCRLECLSLGNVLSTHVEGPAVALLGEEAHDSDNSDDENEDDAEDEEGNPKKPKVGRLYKVEST
jgi:hypothetical protein